MIRSRFLLAGLFLVALAAPQSAGFAQSKPGKAEPDIEEQYAKDSTTEINVKNADIAAIIRIFSKKTKRNYILDEKVAGKVSIYLPGKVSTEESINILDSVLALKGFAAVPIGENLWKIVPAKDAKQSTIPTIINGNPGKPTAAIVTRLFHLKYVAAEDMKQLVQPLISPDGLINAYTGTNALLIIDSENNTERLVNLINELDVPFSDREMTIIPVKHADAPDIAAKLTEILAAPGDTGASAATGADTVRSRLRDRESGDATKGAAALDVSLGATSSSSAKTVAARGREPKIIADERTNSIIVVADDDTTARIRALVYQLDSEVDLSGHRFYVYRCRHADAEELADVLSGLVGGQGGSTGGSTSRNSDEGLTGGDQISGSRNSNKRSSSSTSSAQNRLAGNRRSPGESLNQNKKRPTVTGVNLSEELSISADPATNSLIIQSSKADYEKVKALLDELDIKRRQVLVEAMLLEVTVTDNESMGIDFLASAGGADGGVIAQSNFGSLEQLFTNPAAISNFAVAAASAGTLKLPGGTTLPTQTILLQAAKRNQNVNVLSAPNILATDNEQAEIVVGQNVPFLASTSSSSDNLSNTFNQIDRQDVGITLRLTPQISSEDFVTLNIFTEVSAVVSSTAQSELGPTTTVRTSETTVITKDSQMVVIGGLMSDKANRAEDGVPYLKDIPVLGSFFRTSLDEGERTNLLIFITPRIIRDQFDARDVTIEQKDEMRSEMDRRNVYPRHEEVLENPNVDKVTERSNYVGDAPSTILPPDNFRPLDRSSARLEEPRDREPTDRKPIVGMESPHDDPNVIELRVKPRLPSAAEPPPPQSRIAPSDERASLAAQPSSKSDHYIILDFAGNASDQLPFTVAQHGKSGRFGIVLPGNSSRQALGFFQPGGNYLYGAGDAPMKVQAVGVFDSVGEAQKMYPDLPERWYTLSPHEIMNLGRAPWRAQ